MYEPPQNRDEVLRRYQAGERYFGALEWDDQVYDLQGVCLEWADFTGSFIFADFRNANLRGANFTRCNVKTCDFRGADLTNAVFRGASIDAAEFDGTLLTGTNFEGAYLSGYTIRGGEFPRW